MSVTAQFTHSQQKIRLFRGSRNNESSNTNHVKTIKKIKKINITFVNITQIIYPDKQERLKINKKK